RDDHPGRDDLDAADGLLGRHSKGKVDGDEGHVDGPEVLHFREAFGVAGDVHPEVPKNWRCSRYTFLWGGTFVPGPAPVPDCRQERLPEGCRPSPGFPRWSC